MRVVFVERENGPERLVCDAEMVFEGGPFEGMKLVGFSLWRSAEGEVFVTFPARPFGVGGERRYFDLLRTWRWARPRESGSRPGSRRVLTTDSTPASASSWNLGSGR